jgi:integrase/recombinase XerC
VITELASRYVAERVRRGSLTALSARNHRSTLHRFTQIHREGFCPDYSAQLPAVRQGRTVPRAIDTERLGKLVAILPDRRAKAIVWLMFGCGLRCCEVASLNVEDWSRYDGSARVVGKGGHERIVPVHPVVAAALEDYLAEVPATSGPLIRSTRVPWRALGADTLSGMVSEWMGAAGIKRAARDGVSAHALRHTAASEMFDACHDLTVVQEFLGHAHLQTTAVYLRRAGMARMRDANELRRWVPPDAASG